jgi:high affinity cAMP-specific and IBMX-insensitive 3',5'-cyclic phosphodiesterase 8
VRAVSDGYREENPFHNFAHAFGVAHTAWSMLQTPTAMDLLDSTERLSVLLASLAHDLGHPGNTNAFELNTLSPLALTYNDEAVLERHHCFLAFQLLYRDERCNILGGLKPHSEEMQTIRRTLVHCIMATDMRHHVELVAELERRIDARRSKMTAAHDDLSAEPGLKTPARNRRASLLTSALSVDPVQSTARAGGAVPSRLSESVGPELGHRRSTSSSGAYVFDAPRALLRPGEGTVEAQLASAAPHALAVDAFDPDDEVGRLLFCGAVVHAADLSSQTLPMDLAVPWGRRIAAEFLAQGRLEQERGLKVSVPLWTDDKSFFAGQSYFCRQIVAPLWKAVACVMPEMAVRVDNVERNRVEYDKVVERLATPPPDI